MIIAVTQEHINAGQRCMPKSCPVALAIAALGFEDVSVGGMYISLKGRALLCVPSRVSNFIDAFDNHGEVEPFEFELRTSPAAQGSPTNESTAETSAATSPSLTTPEGDTQGVQS